jgi:hypothetical protein
MMAYMLMPHLQFLVDPHNYFRFEINYGMLTTKGFNVLHLLLVALLLKTGWRRLMPAARTHAWIALVITAPLFIAFCYRDELRNLSLLNMTLAFVTCATISAALSQAAARGERDAPLLQAGVAGAQVSPHPAKAQGVAN